MTAGKAHMISIVQVETDEQIRQARELFEEYFDFLRREVDKVDDLDSVPPLAGYRDEIAGLPGKYAPPEGRLLLARYGAEAAGCVAFYNFGDDACEVKRLWTRPQFRGMKVGKALVETLIAEAGRCGYHTMLLSTVDVLKEAIGLYSTVGFERTAPYYEMPDAMLEHEIFMKLALSPPQNA
jgi:putative acetyltransferase